MNLLHFVAGLFGTTVPALKLLVSIMITYPLADIYDKYVRQHKMFRHIFFIISGVNIAYFNFGKSAYHSFVPAVIIYLSTSCLGPGKMNSVFSFVFNMGYLLIGYVLVESEDITWTLPHYMITFKLIALAFDLWNGQRMVTGEKISVDQKQDAVIEPPTFLELLGFVYFPASFLVGPSFSFKRYRKYTSDNVPLDAAVAEYKNRSKKMLLLGLASLAGYQVGVTMFDIKYDIMELSEMSIFHRQYCCGISCYSELYKCIACWILADASLIRFGLFYNGKLTKKNRNYSKRPCFTTARRTLVFTPSPKPLQLKRNNKCTITLL